MSSIWGAGLRLLSATALCATLLVAGAGSVKAEPSGADLLSALGFDLPLSDLERNVKLQLRDARPPLPPEVVSYASEPFKGEALKLMIAADIEKALTQESRSGVGVFFASPAGARISAMTKEHLVFLRTVGGEENHQIIVIGGHMVQDESKGPLLKVLHDESGRKSIDKLLLRTTSHALVAGDGRLDEASDEAAVQAAFAAVFPKEIFDDLEEFDLPSFAYGYRNASEGDLKAFQAFLSSKEGAAYVNAAEKAFAKRLGEASDQLLARLKEKKS